MSKDYTQYDWASDRLARLSWADEEDRLLNGIDRRMSKRSKRANKSNKKNHRNYA